MKIKTSKRIINRNYKFVIPVGYCLLQYLLSEEKPIAYITRAEGWACDIYEFGNVVITTGYSPFGNTPADYDVTEKYENLAKQIVENESLTHVDKKESLDKLIKEFISETIK